MRKLLCNEEGAVTTDWVVLAAALVGLGAAVLSTISTGSLDLAGRTSQALLDLNVSISPTSAPEMITSDEGTNWFPWIDRSETDENGTWTYNAQNQLIDPNNGDLLPIFLSMNETGETGPYTNGRGEITDENGVVLQ